MGVARNFRARAPAVGPAPGRSQLAGPESRGASRGSGRAPGPLVQSAGLPPGGPDRGRGTGDPGRRLPGDGTGRSTRTGLGAAGCGNPSHQRLWGTAPPSPPPLRAWAWPAAGRAADPQVATGLRGRATDELGHAQLVDPLSPIWRALGLTLTARVPANARFWGPRRALGPTLTARVPANARFWGPRRALGPTLTARVPANARTVAWCGLVSTHSGLHLPRTAW